MGLFTRKSTSFTSSQRLMSQVAAKIDGTPKQIGLPKQREGLGNLISEYGADEVGKFKHAVVAVGNPMTEDEMDNAMLTADKGVKERPAKKAVEHDMILAGAVSQISLGHLIKERYKNYKYVGVVQMIMIFNSSTSFAGKYWEAHVEIVDDRLGDQTAIRGHEMDTNISLRIIMGIDFAIYEEDLYRMYVRVRSGIKREDMRWGSLKIVPSVTFYSGYRILPYIDTWFKPVFSHDHLKERVRDPAFTSSAAVQEDLNALKTLYEDGRIRDESRPDDSGATRECYEGTQFEKRGGADKSRKNKAAIANYMARMEEERKNIPVGNDDEDDEASSEARMRRFVEEGPDDEGSSSSRDSVLSPPPTYREKRKSVGAVMDIKSSGENTVPDVVCPSPRNIIGHDSVDDPDGISPRESHTDDDGQLRLNSGISRRFTATSNGSSGSGAPRPFKKMVVGPGKSILRTGDDNVSVGSSGSRKKKMFKRKSVTMDGIDEVE